MKPKIRKYSKVRQTAIRQNADDQETIKLKLANLYESYFFISNSPWIVRFCFLDYYTRKITVWEYTLQIRKKEMKNLVNSRSVL